MSRSLDPRLEATKAQRRSTEATPSAVATIRAAVVAAATEYRRARVPGAARTAAPTRPSVIPANVSTAWKATPSASAAPNPTPVPCNASVAAPAPAPKFPGVSGKRPERAIDASRTTATQIGRETPRAIAIATAPATRATAEQPTHAKIATPSRGERAIDRKTWSKLLTRPAVLSLRRMQMTRTISAPSASRGAGQSGTRPTSAAGTSSAARAKVQCGGHRSADAARAPEPVVAGKRAREESEAEHTAEVRRRDCVDERPDRVPGGDLGEADRAAASFEPDPPGSSGREQAEGKRQRSQHDPPGLGAGEVAERAAERSTTEPRHAERNACRCEETRADRVAATDGAELTEREFVEEARA